MRTAILKSAITAGAVALAFATTIAPATAVWRGGVGGFHGGGWRGGGWGGMHAWHGGGFNGGWRGGPGWRGHGWGWGPAFGLGVLGGYAAGSALGDGYGYGAYDYSYDAPYGYGYNYGYGDCIAYQPVYDSWGVVVGQRPVNVC